MRHPLIAVIVICTLLLAACGENQSNKTLSNNEALDTLAKLPMNGGRGAINSNSLSVEGLNQAIQAAVKSGKARGISREAVASGIDLTMLNQIFSLIQGQNGQTPSLMNIVNGLSALNGGNTTGVASGLTGLLGVLNAVAPIIATIAPQYAGIIAAITTLIPVMIQFAQIFRRPKPSKKTAELFPIFA